MEKGEIRAPSAQVSALCSQLIRHPAQCKLYVVLRHFGLTEHTITPTYTHTPLHTQQSSPYWASSVSVTRGGMQVFVLFFCLCACRGLVCVCGVCECFGVCVCFGVSCVGKSESRMQTAHSKRSVHATSGIDQNDYGILSVRATFCMALLQLL